MKIGLSKKVISVILAVLMVFTAMPMTALASIDSIDGTDENSALLKDAITAYENKMDGTVYTNMLAAYTAYTDACKAYDAYVYGDQNIDLSTYTDALTTATSAMDSSSVYNWSAYTGITSVAPTFNGTAVSDNNFYGNIVYSDTCTSGHNENSDGSDTSGASVIFTTVANTRVEVYYGAGVAVYDGKNPIVVPVMVAGKRETSSDRYMLTVYPAASGADSTYTSTRPADHSFFTSLYKIKNDDSYNFKGNDGTNKLDFANSRSGGALMGSTRNNEGAHYSDKLGRSIGRNYWNFYATGFQITDDIDFGSSAGYMDFKPYWAWYGDSGTSNASNSEYVDSNMKGYQQASHSIHILNVKGLTDIYPTAVSKVTEYSKNISSYKNSQLSSFFTGLDAATSLSLNDITSATTENASTVGDKLTTAITNLQSTASPDVADGYAALRTAIDDNRSTFNTTESAKYKNWEGFVEVYTAARDIMANIQSTGYNDSAAAQTAADNLNNYVLEVDFTPADTAELIKVIDDGSVAVANKVYFTTESYDAANLEANILQAKKDVWGSEEAYKDTASTTGIEYQSVVDTWESTIGEAILSLVIDKNAVVPSAKDYSMNSAVEYAATINSADYANYSAVAEAVANCNIFITSITVREPGAVAAKIAEYRALVEALVSAITNLQPAFSKIANGTVVNAGTADTTTVSYTKSNTAAADYNSSLTWERPNNVVLFRTTHDAATFDIGTSNFTWYQYVSAYTAYDQYLETLNFAALETLATGELSSNGNYSGTVSDYDGALGASSANGGNYAWNNFIVTGFTGNNGNSYTGKDLNGTGYLLEDYHDYTNDLLKAQNDYTAPSGGIVTHDGSTYFTADGTISLIKTNTTTPSLAESSLPKATEYTVNPYLGYFQYYKYNTLAASTFAGFAYAHNQYTQTTTVIDISYMIDLINTCDGLNYLDYTASSWSDLETALAAAKADMDYGNMTADEIINGNANEIGCLLRYTNLYNAWQALDPVLSNQAIKDALTNTVDTYSATNKAGTYSADSWAAFETAYTAAYNSVYGSSGIYTDINIRSVDATDENTAAIAKIAQDLLDAFNALVKLADFSKLIEAAGTAIDSYVYTVADLQTVADAINSSVYLQYTAEQKAQTTVDEQSAIDAEKQTILDAISALVKKEPIDTTALEAVKTEIAAGYDDPDAWSGIDAAKEFVDSYTSADKLYSEVTIYNSTVYGINYTQENTDAIVTEAKTLVQPQYYDVTVIDSDGNTKSYNNVQYGTEIEVTSIDSSNVDWYYSYKSNTAENTEKYYTTDKLIRFIVKGNTTLRTMPASNSDTAQYKLTVVNSTYSKVASINYVTAGSSFVLPVAAPVAYYTFTGYTVNGETKQAGESITPTANMTIVANYEVTAAAENTMVLMMQAPNGWIFEEFSANYNERIDVTQSTLTTSKQTQKGSITIAGQTVTAGTSGFRRASTSDDIYSYAIVPYEYFDTLYDAVLTFVEEDQYTGEKTYNAGDAAGIASLVSYGQDYSFYSAGDIILIPLTEEETNDFIASGIVKPDANGADVSVRGDLVLTDTKFSIVSTFALPQGAELVEAGILFSKNQTADLTFKNVDSQNVYRLKSSLHTVGNQFVISIMNPSTSQDVKYLSYLIYELNGVQYHIESDAVCTSYVA